MTGEMTTDDAQDTPTSPVLIGLAWLIVLVPLAFGLWQTLLKVGLLLAG